MYNIYCDKICTLTIWDPLVSRYALPDKLHPQQFLQFQDYKTMSKWVTKIVKNKCPLQNRSIKKFV